MLLVLQIFKPMMKRSSCCILQWREGWRTKKKKQTPVLYLQSFLTPLPFGRTAKRVRNDVLTFRIRAEARCQIRMNLTCHKSRNVLFEATVSQLFPSPKPSTRRAATPLKTRSESGLSIRRTSRHKSHAQPRNASRNINSCSQGKAGLKAF